MSLTMALFGNVYLLSLLTCVAAGQDFMRSPDPQLTFNLTLTEIKNPKFNPHPVSTIEIYAAPFIKHDTPMPPKLSAAWEAFQSIAHGYGSVIKAREIGETMNGTDYE